MDLRRTGPYMVGDRQRAPPASRSDRTSQRRQERLRWGVGNRQRRDFGDGLGLADGQPFCAFGGSNAGRQRVSGIDRHVHHAAALYTIPWPPGTLRKHLTLVVAILVRIGINDAAYSARLVRDFGLDGPPRRAV